MKTQRISAALTAFGLVGALGACSMPGQGVSRSASIFGGKVDKDNIGLATRAQAALLAGDAQGAIQFAERAVGQSPNDAGFRSLLGNIYLTAGRFASAEDAYRDSLSLLPHQPQIALKLALSQIAQGKAAQARGHLAGARHLIDPADYGLALALAGDHGGALQVLGEAARSAGADARVRQNLALAHALAGQWDAARTVAAQDLDPAQLDQRVRQWMAMATPTRASDQVAGLLGVSPAATDPGQPSRLALRAPSDRLAMAAPAPAPVAEVADVVEVAAPQALAEAPARYVPVAAAPVAVAMAAPAPAPVAAPANTVASVAMRPASPVVANTPVPASLAAALAAIAPVLPALPTVVAPRAPAGPAPELAAPRPALSPRAASLSDDVPVLRKAPPAIAARAGSRSIVQLASYSARDRVAVGWNRLTGRYPALRGYSPVSAAHTLGASTVYRLSVQGFSSRRDAQSFCVGLKKAGAPCFVRDVAGDAPARVGARG